MNRFRERARAVATRFLPCVVTLLVVTVLIEPLRRGRSVVQSIQHVYLPLFVAEPVLIAAGVFLGLLVLGEHVRPETLKSGWSHIAGASTAVLGLGIASIFMQGLALPWILGLCIAAGALTAFIFFGPLRRVTAATAT